MKQEELLTVYGVAISTTLGMLGNFTKYDIFWVIFMLGGMFIMIGHSIWDKKVKHSAGKLVWMIVTSFITCLYVKFLHDEGTIESSSMVIATLVCSMIAPATTSILLNELPDKMSETILTFPAFFGDLIKKSIEKWTK